MGLLAPKFNAGGSGQHRDFDRPLWIAPNLVKIGSILFLRGWGAAV